MKLKKLVFLLVGLMLVTGLFGQWTPPSADQDTVYIEGGEENAGRLEGIVNNDLDSDGSRMNPNRVYKLESGTVHYMYQQFDVDNPDGTVQIVGEKGGSKPVIAPTERDGAMPGGGDVLGLFNSSLTLKNVYVQGMNTNGNNYTWVFRLNGDGRNLDVENSVFEFSYLGIFDLNNVGNGLDITLSNNYFRNLDDGQEWWDSRVYQAKVPTDSVIIENNTVSNSGLTFLHQGYETKFWFFNHNTLINSKKYPRISPYFKEAYITNNVFVNCNWVGEDINVWTSGQDPDGIKMGIVNVDTIETANHSDTTQAPSYGLGDYEIYAANNVHYVSDMLDPYYNGEFNDTIDAPISNIDWGKGKPNVVENAPPLWMNSRTEQLFNEYENIHAENNWVNGTDTEVSDLQLNTPGIPNEEVRDSMVVWNQARWAATDYSTFSASDVTSMNWAFGDLDPNTIPEVTSVTDFPEDFSYGADVESAIDQKHVGALHWYPSEMDSYDFETQLSMIKEGYSTKETAVDAGETEGKGSFELEQNYPNPFNPTTTINYKLKKAGKVKLTVYNVLGEKVKTLVNKNVSKLNNTVKWNATNEAGQKVSSGVYFYKIEAPTNTRMKKMMLLK